MSDTKQKYFPLKPDSEEGFKDPVSWLGGRELVTSLKGMIIYSLYGESIDPRPWMKSVVYPELKGLSDDASADDMEEAANKAWAAQDAEYREWKKERFEFWQNYLEKNDPENKEEFWLDYIADSGDGQLGVYGVGCLCLSDLWLAANGDVGFSPDDQDDPKEELLPRGSFLFVGGDTAYHVADYSSIHERFQLPFRWAFASVRKYLIDTYKATNKLEHYFWPDKKLRTWKADGVGTEPPFKFDSEWDGTLCKMYGEMLDYWDTEPLRPLFGVPANHDYYDDLDGFNRQFRRPPFATVDENKADPRYMDMIPLKIPTYRREQEASYTALRLPFGWWFLAIDSENEKLDFRQRAFFEQLMDEEQPKKVIIATPEPTTVFGRECDPDLDKTTKYIAAVTKGMGIDQPFLVKGVLKQMDELPKDDAGSPIPFRDGDYCRLDLSGDVHHYSRYWGPENAQPEHSSENYASLVAGGGGAFFDSTDTLIGKAVVTRDGKQQEVAGEVPPQITFPDDRCSRNAIADRLFDLSNIKKGGYIQIAGAGIAVLLYFFIIYVGHINDFFTKTVKWTHAWEPSGLIFTLAVVACVSLFLVSAVMLHSLNARLKLARQDSNPGEGNGRFSQLRYPSIFFILGIAVYIVFLYLYSLWGPVVLRMIDPFIQGILLLLHLVGAGVALWTGTEYLNWLPLRFKFVRIMGEAPDSWISIISTRLDMSTDRFLSEHGDLLKRLWQWWRTKSVENVPVYILNSCAAAILVTGVYLFGGRALPDIGADLILTSIILGALIGLIYLAVSTGAAYHKKRSSKLWFAILGIWHAVLQLATPLILLYFAPWRLVVAILVFAVIMNGLAGTRTALKFFFPGIDRAGDGWKRILWGLSTGSVGAFVMKNTKPIVLFFVWLIYGAAVLILPLMFSRSYRNSAVVDVITSWVRGSYPSALNWLPEVLILIIAGFIGYRLSRIWISWYFAVAMAYNGHNNEAGGAARIQGFKHILRIKVEKDQLTVYVIGFDRPEAEMTDLKPKLVDTFTLRCKTLKDPGFHASGKGERPA